MYRLFLVLTFFSGVGGIAYEVLYSRLLSAYIGDIFYISAMVLTTFLLGIGLGSLFSYRFVSYLKYIEIGLGLYAIFIATLFQTYGLSITKVVLSVTQYDAAGLSFLVFLILFLPAIAVGFSVPLFSQYMAVYVRGDHSFTKTYIFYNLGAAASVILLEFVLVRLFGLSMSMYVVASINLAIGTILFFVPTPTRILAAPKRILQNTSQFLLAALVLLSVGSGIVQLAMFDVLERFVGPIGENMSLFVGAVLFSIAIASVLVYRFHIPFVWVFLTTPLTLSFMFLCMVPIIGTYLELYTNYVRTSVSAVTMNALLVFFFVSPIFISFGLSVPFFVQKIGTAFSGTVLALSAFGNVAGYLIFVFVLSNHFSTVQIIAGTIIGLGMLALATAWNKSRNFLALYTGALALCLTVLVVQWPSNFSALYAGHELFNSNVFMEAANANTVNTFQNFGEHAVIIESADTVRLAFNGYHSLTFSEHMDTVLNEALVGLAPGFFSERHDTALVLGLGSGLTASAAAENYEHVVVAEINPSMLGVAEYFAAENNYVLDKPNVTVAIQDGLITLLGSEKKFDAIVNTVPSPAYFSSHKLWSADVLEVISHTLAPGGVYVGWLDGRLTDDGFAIMGETLSRAFNECAFLYINQSYYAFICTNEQLTFDSEREGSADILQTTFDEVDWDDGLNNFLRQLIFRAEFGDVDGRVHTLDHPWLAFVHAYPMPENVYLQNSPPEMFDRDLMFLDIVTGKQKNQSSVCKAFEVMRAYMDGC